MKKVIAMLLASVMVLSLAACGAAANATPEQKEVASEAVAAAAEAAKEVVEEAKSEDTAAEATEETVLKIAAFEGGNGADFWTPIIAAFEETHPGVKVEITTNPKIEDIVTPQIVAGEYPDIYYPGSATNPLYMSLVNERQLLDISDIYEGPGFDHEEPLKDQIVDGFLSSTSCDIYQDGHVYTAPLSICTRGLIYNKKLFADHGWEVPETWDEFFALGDEAKKEGIALMTYAGTYPDYLDTLIWPSLAGAIGADKVYQISRRTEGIITTPEARAVFENIAKIGQQGYLLEGTVGMNHTQSQSEFILNKCLFCPNGDWIAQEMADAPHAEGFEYGLCPAPTMEKGQKNYTRSTPDIITIPAGTEHPELAKEFIRFLYTDEAVKAFATGGILQCTKTAKDITEGLFDESFLSMHEVDAYSTALVYQWKPDEEGSRIILWDVVYNPIADVMTNNETAEQWVDDIEAAFHAANNGE